MVRFRPKPGPLLTRERFQHLTWGGFGSGFGLMVGGQTGAALGFAAVLAVGFALEFLTPILGRRLGWDHLEGDLIDLVAYLPLGGLVLFLAGLPP